MKKIELTKSGRYVRNAQCGKNHSGSVALLPYQGEHYQCQGCGSYYTEEEIVEAIDSAREASRLCGDPITATVGS